MGSREQRVKTLWTGAVTVAVLAIILIVLGMMGPLFKGEKPAGPQPRAIGSSGAAASTALVKQAETAIQSGDTTRAAELAAQALAADASNTAARTLLDSIKTSPTTGSGSSTSASSTTSPSTSLSDAQYLKTIEDLATLLPTQMSGVVLDLPVQVKRDITLSGSPTRSDGAMRGLSWAVHDMKTAAAAKSFVAKTSRSLFPKDAANLTIGESSAYFGTDGTQFATLSFVRGRYVFEVLATSHGVAPREIKATVVAAARAFPH